MFSLDPNQLELRQLHNLVIGTIAPRPIALVSTQSPDGDDNLAPFSFFNAFSSNPPVVVFSPASRGRDGSLKDTYNNLMATKECVIHIVTYSIVEQMNVTSTEYPANVDEFVKSGFTKIKSDIVKPFRVKESPVHLECTLRQMISLGEKKASGHLAICDIVKFHIEENLFVDEKVIVEKMDQVARNGGAYYTRATPESMFTVVQPTTHLGIGFDQLPESFKQSHELSANDLGQLALIVAKPTQEASVEFVKKLGMKDLLATAKVLLRQRRTLEAWMVLICYFE